jgi:hypothetical protein
MILEALAAERPTVRVHRIRHPRESHDFVSGYAGAPVWVVGFDGDQLLDPKGLATLRPRLLAGEFDTQWALVGRGFNCRELDTRAGIVVGYHAPPARGTPKLFNFAAIEAWDGATEERLHGGTIQFRRGYGPEHRDDRFQRMSWDETPLRWLHLCFLRRSSRRPETVRLNPAEAAARRAPRERLRHAAAQVLRQPSRSGKEASYSRGSATSVDARPFFSLVPHT